MRWLPVLLAVCACTPAPEPPEPSPPPRAVIELYMHPDGKSNCVDGADGEWKAILGCCPDGFEEVGFSVPAATAYVGDEDDVKRRLYRHVVCLEERPEAE